MLTNLAELESQARQFAIETSKEGKSLLSLLNDLKTVAGLGRIFQKLQLVQLQRDPTLETYKAIHVKQTEDLEASMEEELVPHFNRVLKDVAGKIPSVPTDITDEDKAAKTAKRITDSIFTDTTLDEYNKDLFKSSLTCRVRIAPSFSITAFWILSWKFLNGKGSLDIAKDRPVDLASDVLPCEYVSLASLPFMHYSSTYDP